MESSAKMRTHLKSATKDQENLIQLHYLRRKVMKLLLEHPFSSHVNQPYSTDSHANEEDFLNLDKINKRLETNFYTSIEAAIEDFNTMFNYYFQENAKHYAKLKYIGSLYKIFLTHIQSMSECGMEIKNFAHSPVHVTSKNIHFIMSSYNFNSEKLKKQLYAKNELTFPMDFREDLPRALQFCADILAVLLSKRNSTYAWPFYKPHRETFSNLHDYQKQIKKPMDLFTVKMKLEKQFYRNIRDFYLDVILIFMNCARYHSRNHHITELAKELVKLFEKMFKKTLKNSCETDIAEYESESDISDFDDDGDDDSSYESERCVRKVLKIKKDIIKYLPLPIKATPKLYGFEIEDDDNKVGCYYTTYNSILNYDNISSINNVNGVYVINDDNVRGLTILPLSDDDHIHNNKKMVEYEDGNYGIEMKLMEKEPMDEQGVVAKHDDKSGELNDIENDEKTNNDGENKNDIEENSKSKLVSNENLVEDNDSNSNVSAYSDIDSLESYSSITSYATTDKDSSCSDIDRLSSIK